MNQSELREFSVYIVKTLRDHGYEAYFAGGCVRDQLLGIEPKDFDVASNALPDEVRALFPRTVSVGEAFNVIRVISPHEENPFTVEVATFRKDIGIADGRHPAQVQKATAREDVERRDFTINGMLYDPVDHKVLDWVGGQEDLRKKIIRAIGDPSLRIEEDHLRMLRAIRFASRFNYRIDDELWKVMVKKSPLIQNISAERIFDEITRMLTEGRARLAFEKLDESGLLKEVLPEMLEMKNCAQPPEYHPEGDVWIHTLMLLEHLTPHHSREVAWGCLLHDIGKPRTFTHEPPDRIRFNGHARVGAEMSKEILKRLRAPGSLVDVVYELVDQHLRFADAPKMRPSTLKRFIRQEYFDAHLEQHRIDCLASHGKLEIYEFCKKAIAEMGTEILRPPALVNGGDLIAMGYKPGPLFKEILEAVETEQLEGRLKDPEAAKAFVHERYSI